MVSFSETPGRVPYVCPDYMVKVQEERPVLAQVGKGREICNILAENLVTRLSQVTNPETARTCANGFGLLSFSFQEQSLGENLWEPISIWEQVGFLARGVSKMVGLKDGNHTGLGSVQPEIQWKGLFALLAERKPKKEMVLMELGHILKPGLDLSISLDAVSIYVTSPLAWFAWQAICLIQDPSRGTNCQHCQTPIFQPSKSKEKVYCSSVCRVAALRERRKG